ncbi:MAG: PEP-CTERM sorting domain-containing protein [Pirellulales bacterium]|nr:PEP-CTERM sorting domain-containing protein [Pirellulales bacterium]
MKSRPTFAAALTAAAQRLYAPLILAVAAPAAVGAPVILQNATATATQGGFSISQTIDGNLGGVGVINGWAIHDNIGNIDSETAVYETLADVGGPGGAAFTFTLTQNYGSSITIGRFRLSITEDDRSSFADGLNQGGDVTANWIVLGTRSAVATNDATLTIQPDGSILAGGASPATTVYTVTAATEVTSITGIRLEAIDDASLPNTGPGRAPNGNLVLQEFAVDVVDFPDPPTADFDENGMVNGSDLAIWKTGFGTGATHMQGNTNTQLDSDVDGGDFLIWQRQLGGPGGAVSSSTTVSAVVPEPASIALIGLGGVGLLRRRRV